MHTTQLESLLNWRYAVRKFSEQSIAQDKVDKLIELTGLSASAFGLQPYKVIQISDQATKQALLAHSYGQQKVLDNSHLLVFAADMSPLTSQIERYIQDFKANRDLDELVYSQMEHGMKDALKALDGESQYNWCSEQAHLALGTLLLAAASMEIDACPMTGIDKAAYDEVLALSPLNLKTVLIVPIGIRDSSDVNAGTSKVRKSKDLLHIEV
ncbi:nitroreductase family protein [Pseudoalteromonas piscicida]|uniref:NAD(P)H-dependent oxidoreductase n=1 Tax=Pseudoalteromonas piscicida TaxID=43662 RepID=A0A2A5JTG1_PSEO7|nr:nitroreductase family protein [Pseudoalteromonas piscicida]PCK32762.1 NAD(P)H-dependent oxidoreductase [Pseudoalteromonas piscicida]